MPKVISFSGPDQKMFFFFFFVSRSLSLKMSFNKYMTVQKFGVSIWPYVSLFGLMSTKVFSETATGQLGKK